MEGVSIRLAILNHPSSILKPSPILPYSHTFSNNNHATGFGMKVGIPVIPPLARDESLLFIKTLPF